MKKNLFKSVAFVASLLLIQGCMDKLNLTSYSIEYPVKDATYIGTVNNAPPAGASGTEQLAGEFIINYATPPSSQPDIVLNGHKISRYFAFGPSQATAEVSKFSRFFRHGKNTLSVAPTSFGPSMTFNLDMQGPTLIITRGSVISGGTEVEIEGYLRDFSVADSVMDLDLVQVAGYQADGRVIRQVVDQVQIPVNGEGKFCASHSACKNGAVPTGAVYLDTLLLSGIPLLYSFTARDVYGYMTKKEFMADTDGTAPLPTQNAVQVALGDTFIESMRPVIANGIYNSLKAAPMDARCVTNPNNAESYIDTVDGFPCTTWDNPKVCGNKRGVIYDYYNGTNVGVTAKSRKLTEEEFEKLDLKDGVKDRMALVDTNNDGVEESISINNAYFDCDAADRLTDGSKMPINKPIRMPVSIAGSTLNLDILIQRFYMHDGSPLTIGDANLNNRVGTVLLNEFKVLSDDRIDVNLDITEMLVGMHIPVGGSIDVEIGKVYISSILVDSEVLLQKDRGGNLLVELQNSNIALGALKMNSARLCLDLGWLGRPCINLDGIIGLLEGMLPGIVGPLLPDILNPILKENLQKLVIGGMVSQPQNQTAFDMLMNIEEMGTQQKYGVIDLKVALDSTVNILKGDSYVSQQLGAVFFDDPINPEDIYNALGGTPAPNLTVAVNSNLINQSLAAMHAAGVTFFTFYNGKTYYGGHPNVPAVDPTDANSPSLAKKGDSRIRLWPDMPPAVVFSEVPGSQGAGRAAIEFDSATLYQDVLVEKAGQLVWENRIKLNVNFDLAININEQDGVFTMAAAGPPVFRINEMVNNTPVQVPAAMLQMVLDTAMLFGGDLLADQFIVLNLNQMVSKNLNGTVVRFLDNKDNWKIPGAGEFDCVVYDETGNTASPHPQSSGIIPGGDGKYDLVCHTIDVMVSTKTAGVAGTKGSNLFFQMILTQGNLPTPPGLPRFDIDDDKIPDYQDNCSISTTDLEGIIQANYPGGLSTLIDTETGEPLPGVEEDLRAYAHTLLASRMGPLTQEDKDWFNTRRDGSLVTDNNWAMVLYNNPSQVDSDGDRIGNLCESDTDRDGVWNDYADAPQNNDNCPFTYNPGQEDTYGDPNSGSGDACNIRRTFMLVKNKMRADAGQPACLSHENFSVPYTGGSSVDPANSTNGFRYLAWRDCDQADPAVRFYFKEGVSVPGAPAPTDSVVVQLWQTETRDGFFLATSVAGSGTPQLTADDVVITHHPNYATDQYNDWIFYGSGDQDYPYLIKSYKFYARDYPAASNWCVFYKNGHNGSTHPIPDQDSDSCAISDGTGRQYFQMLVGPEMAPWNGRFD